jgi:hypothetical protein
MYVAELTTSLTAASIVIFVIGLFIVMLYERERSKERKHAER